MSGISSVSGNNHGRFPNFRQYRGEIKANNPFPEFQLRGSDGLLKTYSRTTLKPVPIKEIESERARLTSTVPLTTTWFNFGVGETILTAGQKYAREFLVEQERLRLRDQMFANNNNAGGGSLNLDGGSGLVINNKILQTVSNVSREAPISATPNSRIDTSVALIDIPKPMEVSPIRERPPIVSPDFRPIPVLVSPTTPSDRVSIPSPLDIEMGNGNVGDSEVRTDGLPNVSPVHLIHTEPHYDNAYPIITQQSSRPQKGQRARWINTTPTAHRGQIERVEDDDVMELNPLFSVNANPNVHKRKKDEVDLQKTKGIRRKTKRNKLTELGDEFKRFTEKGHHIPRPRAPHQVNHTEIMMDAPQTGTLENVHASKRKGSSLESESLKKLKDTDSVVSDRVKTVVELIRKHQNARTDKSRESILTRARKLFGKMTPSEIDQIRPLIKREFIPKLM